MLLKDVPGVLPALATSAVTNYKIWNRDVKDLHPTQLVAIRTKELELNPNSKIDEELAHLTLQLQFAVLDELCESPLIHYNRPRDRSILTSEFIAGLKALKPAYRFALIFGMEMGLSAIRTANLTVKQAHQLTDQTELAQSALRSTLLSTKTIYMFWTVDEATREHVPLDDLNEAVYEAFGMTWMDLGFRYHNMAADHYNPIIFSE